MASEVPMDLEVDYAILGPPKNIEQIKRTKLQFFHQQPMSIDSSTDKTGEVSDYLEVSQTSKEWASGNIQ